MYVKELDLFMTVKLLEDTLAVLSLGKLCEEHEYFTSWPVVNYHILLKMTEGFAAIRKSTCRLLLQGCQLDPPARLQVRPQHRHTKTLKIQHLVQQSHEVRVQVVSSDDPEKSKIKNKDKDIGEAQGTRCAIFLTGWKISQRILRKKKFRHSGTPASSSHESETAAPREVASGKHSVYSHIPKDRNCEVCLRTKMTRAS